MTQSSSGAEKPPSKIVVNEVSKVFTPHGSVVTALSGIDLSISDGEFVSLLGTSGCGKSTLLRIIAGLETATSGSVSVDGRVVDRPGADRGMVFQAYTLFPWRTVLRNITFGMEQRGVRRRQAMAAAQEYVELVGLSGFEDVYPSSLSGGMKQRVALARALAADPQVLLLDEPFGALDMQTRESMQDLLRQVWERTHKTVVMVTHDVDEAVLLSDRIVIMVGQPGVVRQTIDVELGEQRDAETRFSPEFLEYRRSAAHALHAA